MKQSRTTAELKRLFDEKAMPLIDETSGCVESAIIYPDCVNLFGNTITKSLINAAGMAVKISESQPPETAAGLNWRGCQYAQGMINSKTLLNGGYLSLLDTTSHKKSFTNTDADKDI